MTVYMLDTNTVSFLIRGNLAVKARLLQVPMSSLSMSAVTEAELHFGLAKRPEATQLAKAVGELLLRVEVLPFGRAAALCCGIQRARLEAQGKLLSPLDMMIGSHAISEQRTLVTNDKAFSMLKDCVCEDWTT